MSQVSSTSHRYRHLPSHSLRRKMEERKSKNNVRSQTAGTEKLEIDDPEVTYITFIFLIISRNGTVVAVIYGSWIYYYLCNQCLLPLMLWGRISIRVRCTPLCGQVCQWLATGRWFSLCPPVSSNNKTDRHEITEILLKVALNSIQQQTNKHHWW